MMHKYRLQLKRNGNIVRHKVSIETAHPLERYDKFVLNRQIYQVIEVSGDLLTILKYDVTLKDIKPLN